MVKPKSKQRNRIINIVLTIKVVEVVRIIEVPVYRYIDVVVEDDLPW
jgi:hypothetical protein